MVARVSLDAEIPGRGTLAVEHLVLDVNGTLTDRGTLIEGVAERLARLLAGLEVHLLSADTFGSLGDVSEAIGVPFTRIGTGEDKRRIVVELGADRCVAIGNGANDAAMLETAALGIVVMGPEGAAGRAIAAADVVCGSIVDALDLLLDERALVATLRP
jgi:soluble P-type ATPase